MTHSHVQLGLQVSRLPGPLGAIRLQELPHLRVLGQVQGALSLTARGQRIFRLSPFLGLKSSRGFQPKPAKSDKNPLFAESPQQKVINLLLAGGSTATKFPSGARRVGSAPAARSKLATSRSPRSEAACKAVGSSFEDVAVAQKVADYVVTPQNIWQWLKKPEFQNGLPW